MNLEPQSKFRISEIESLVDSADKEIRLSKATLSVLKHSNALVKNLASSDSALYGINTGFGRLAQKRIPSSKLLDLQLNILRSHASGIGDPSSARVVRRLLWLRAISLGKGFSGISPEFIEMHLNFLARGLTPFIPEQGSVGASGDLAPLAHLALTFIGEGDFVLASGKTVDAMSVLKKFRWRALRPGPKDGLALVNGTQFSLSLALEARRELSALLPWMEKAQALSLEAHRGSAQPFRDDLNSLKAHRSQRKVAEKMMEMLKGSPHIEDHKDCDLVQDSYSFRCIPQVVGPAYSVLEKADELLEGEINSVSDNPIVFVKSKEIVSGGHFHAQSVSLAADLMCLSMATLGNLIERRIDQMMNPLTTRTKAFFAEDAGVESGLMILQTAAAAIASENKTLAHPASADSIPTNGLQEDHVSMAPWAGRKALLMTQNLRRLIAAEILSGVRGAILEKKKKAVRFGDGVEKFLGELKKSCPQIFHTRESSPHPDWLAVEKILKN